MIFVCFKWFLFVKCLIWISYFNLTFSFNIFLFRKKEFFFIVISYLHGERFVYVKIGFLKKKKFMKNRTKKIWNDIFCSANLYTSMFQSNSITHYYMPSTISCMQDHARRSHKTLLLAVCRQGKKPAYFLLVKINCLFLIILIQHFCSVYSTKKMFSFSLCVLLSMPIFQLKMNKPKGDTHTCRIFAYSLSSLIFSIYIHETFNLLIEDKRLNHQISCHFYQIENGKFMKVIFCLFLVKCFECVCNFAFFSTSPLLTSQCYLGQPVYFSKISIWVDSLCNKK